MESSEDDAGTATSASRRPSAREKDVEQAENVDSARNYQHELSEARTSTCGTPAMSEDNFDGDSVPSPSSKETSTEAILDMIDDFIGDPRAPRLPSQAAAARIPTPVPSASDTQHKQSEAPKEQITTPPRVLSPLTCAPIEILSESGSVQPAEAKCTPQSEILICVNTNSLEESSQAGSSIQVDSNESCSTQEPEISENVIQVLTEEPIVAPPSSSVVTVQETSDTSECESLRTVKCVTSSESRDSVTVELAESTSSECSVSESKSQSVEPNVSRSPLKRRLIRPAPSDRRPDSTVSSTADSQSTDINTSEQASSDTVAKDVSSSSDAVPNMRITTTPEEISDVSEISICKAETSTAPSRKIKLVRPKLAPMMSSSVKCDTPVTSAPIERDRCQSTSSDEILTPAEPAVDTSNCVFVKKSEEQEIIPDLVPEISPPEQLPAQITRPLEAESDSEAAVSNNTVEKDPKCIETQQVVEPSVSETSAASSVIEASEPILLPADNVIPLQSNLSETKIAPEYIETPCSSTNQEQPHNESQTSIPVEEDNSQVPVINCNQGNKANNCEDEQKKVPPLKINLTNTDHGKKSEVPTVVPKSQIVQQDSTSTKAEDTKQVPKLTIKLSNKAAEEIKSPIPKLTIKPLLPPVEPNIEVQNTNQQVQSVKKLNVKVIPKPTEKDVSPEKSILNPANTEEIQSVTKLNIKPIPKPIENVNEIRQVSTQSAKEQETCISDISKPILNVTKINIKPIPKPVDEGNQNVPSEITSQQQAIHSNNTKPACNVAKLNVKPLAKPTENAHKNQSLTCQPVAELDVGPETSKQIPSVIKLNIKPIPKPTEKVNDSTSISDPVVDQNSDDSNSKQIPNVTKINIKPIPKPAEKLKESTTKLATEKDIEDQQIPSVTKINIKPIPKPSDKVNENPSKSLRSGTDKADNKQQVPNITKLNIKPITKPAEKDKESTLKSVTEQNIDYHETNLQIPSVTKINIKSISKPSKINDSTLRSHTETGENDISKNEQIPVITKLNIKPIVKPPEKINEVHRKSSSSEISESEYSENDESTSTSDQASTSDQGPLDAVPKLTIKLGKPGTESEGKFYTQKNVPKLTIKNVQQSDKDDQAKLIISQSDEKQMDKVPKITIKTVTKSDSQPLSPKLTIKPIKPPENVNKEEIPKLKISTEPFSSNTDVKENQHVPKITIKPVTKTDGDGSCKTPKKCDSSENIPVVTKLNIKPVLKPTESGECSESYDEKVPVVSKLNIKPVIKPKDNEVDSKIEDVPKITKLNIKPLKNPEESSSDKKDCDEMNTDMQDSCIPVVTKINIKPIVKPVEEEASKDSENQSSETGNSSDENTDHIPVVTKLNIKPIVKPSEIEEPAKSTHNEQSIPVVTKLNIKPLVKPEDQVTPASPKKECLKSPGSSGIPVLTKLNIKPIVKPEELQSKPQEENIDKPSKPPLLMKINMKNVSDSITENEHMHNDVSGKAHSPKTTHSPKMAHSPKATKRSMILERNADSSSKPASSVSEESIINPDCHRNSPSLLQSECLPTLDHSGDTKVPENLRNAILKSIPKEQLTCTPVTTEESASEHSSTQESKTKSEPLPHDNKIGKKNAIQSTEVNDKNWIAEHYNTNYTKASILNCTLLKKLLSSTKEVEKSPDLKTSNCVSISEKSEPSISNCKDRKAHEESQSELLKRLSPQLEVTNESKHSSDSVKIRPIEEVHREANESVTKPLEIVTDKIGNQSSGQDSPRIILKINKTDHGASSKIITEEPHKPPDSSLSDGSNACEVEPHNDSISPKKLVNSRRKAAAADLVANMTMGKRLRSSRIVESADKSPAVKRNVNKRPPAAESPSILQQKESEQSLLETKRMKLEQLLSANKSLTITPVVTKVSQTSPTKSSVALNPGGKVSHNHSLLNNENSQKNGNSKLQNILSNLQAKQLQTLQMNDTSVTEKPADIAEVETSVSTGSSDVVVEITRVENCLDVQEMLINENSVCDLTGPDEVSQDPLDVANSKTPEVPKAPSPVQPIEMTPTPRKRGRPRKTPLVEADKPSTPMPTPLPVSALEERPQRSLRLTREKPPILRKPRGRGRGRGRGGRRAASPPAPSPEPEPEPEPETETEPVIVVEVAETRATSPIDPTSSRIKLPRMTEALDKSVAGASCTTPLSSRRHSSTVDTDLKLFSSAAVVLDSPVKAEEFMKSPEAARTRGGRGSRGGRGRTPRGRGRGRGGGRGAMYMKETMGIYGRVCGPATTTVQLFEEETCMMDDNATPSKPSHLLDEDSQSSVKSSTNDSNKMKKSKFADLFDSNKVWTAADVKEYTWPPSDTPNAEPQIMMIQEQVAMFLGVKSFKRRYPELKRRTVGGEEREYVLSKGIVSEALCDLGITAVDASEVLDIMLSDYPHKYEEYRSHQRERQMAASEEPAEVKVEEKSTRIEIKSEKTSDKPEPPKVDPEKTRQDMAAAAMASAAEWNARANAWRRPACVDLQSNTIHRRRAPPPAPPPVRVRPPHGFYPHALLPGQYQHWYRTYTPEQLRYFPLSTVLAAPPAPPSPADSSSESEGSWGDNSSSSEDSDGPHHNSAKRKKLSRVKRSSQQDKEESRGASSSASGGGGGEVDTCRVCKLRLEANRKHTHERFLVCSQCNAKLHPACVELPADTIRKCRSYAWQCAECKSCCACRRPQDDDKMLFCDLCDRGFHIYCVGLTAVPSGRWHCVECAICKSCGARDPNGHNPGSATPGLSTPGPSTPGPSTPGPSTPGPSTPGPSTPGPSTVSTPGVSSGPGEWHHQTRRGPGGHKVYSHSLCTPCARAYRIGRYCPLCERSFIGPKGTMQLVICKLCDRQLHQECVRQTVSSLRVLDYTCAECRRGGITSRSAAVRAAPRTIATLFMAKRRFNKYAHKQYLASRLQAQQDAAAEDADADAELAPPTDDDASRDVDPLEGVGDDAAAAPPDD